MMCSFNILVLILIILVFIYFIRPSRKEAFLAYREIYKPSSIIQAPNENTPEIWTSQQYESWMHRTNWFGEGGSYNPNKHIILNEQGDLIKKSLYKPISNKLQHCIQIPCSENCRKDVFCWKCRNRDNLSTSSI